MHFDIYPHLLNAFSGFTICGHNTHANTGKIFYTNYNFFSTCLLPRVLSGLVSWAHFANLQMIGSPKWLCSSKKYIQITSLKTNAETEMSCLKILNASNCMHCNVVQPPVVEQTVKFETKMKIQIQRGNATSVWIIPVHTAICTDTNTNISQIQIQMQIQSITNTQIPQLYASNCSHYSAQWLKKLWNLSGNLDWQQIGMFSEPHSISSVSSLYHHSISSPLASSHHHLFLSVFFQTHFMYP